MTIEEQIKELAELTAKYLHETGSAKPGNVTVLVRLVYIDMMLGRINEDMVYKELNTNAAIELVNEAMTQIGVPQGKNDIQEECAMALLMAIKIMLLKVESRRLPFHAVINLAEFLLEGLKKYYCIDEEGNA